MSNWSILHNLLKELFLAIHFPLLRNIGILEYLVISLESDKNACDVLHADDYFDV